MAKFKDGERVLLFTDFNNREAQRWIREMGLSLGKEYRVNYYIFNASLSIRGPYLTIIESAVWNCVLPESMFKKAREETEEEALQTMGVRYGY